MSKRQVTRFRCPVCGKLTAGRLPRSSTKEESGRRVGDGTFRFPRRHKGPDGRPCPGNVMEAEWVDVEVRR